MNVCTKYLLWWKIHKSIKRIVPCCRGLVSLEAPQPVGYNELARCCPHWCQKGIDLPASLSLVSWRTKIARERLTHQARGLQVPWENGSEFYKPPALKKMIPMMKLQTDRPHSQPHSPYVPTIKDKKYSYQQS